MIIIVGVDRLKTLKEIIELGKFNIPVSPNVYHSVVACKSSDSIDLVSVEFIHFNTAIDSRKILPFLQSKKITPADVQTFLSMAVQYPDLQRNVPIVCLDPVMSINGEEFVLCLIGNEKFRGVVCIKWGLPFLPEFRFLVVASDS